MLEKVVVYITQGNMLLVFRHTDYSEAGIKVPAGTVKSGENLTDAAFRKASEETGLSLGELILRNRLGSDTIRVGDMRGIRTIHRHFFNLEFLGNAPQLGYTMKTIHQMVRRRRFNLSFLGRSIQKKCLY